MNRVGKSDLPFGIDMRTGIQGLTYSRMEVFLEEVSKPHEYFVEHRVSVFPQSQSFVIRADSDLIPEKETALDMFEQILYEMIDKYRLPVGGKDGETLDWEYHLETGMNPMKNWLFEFDPDGSAHLAWIMLRIIQHDVAGWAISVSYSYQTEKEQTAL